MPRSLATMELCKKARDRQPFLLACGVPNTISVIGFTCSKSQDFPRKKTRRVIIASPVNVMFVRRIIILNYYYCTYSARAGSAARDPPP